MASSKFLSCSLGNDAGATQMLSCGNSPILKLVGPSNSSKFTPNKRNFYTIDSINYGGKNINLIPINLLYAKSLEDFIDLSYEYELNYISINKNGISEVFYPYLNEIYENEEKFPYLTKVFDTEKEGFEKLKAKVFQIDYQKFYQQNN